jgi:outer membrane protein
MKKTVLFFFLFYTCYNLNAQSQRDTVLTSATVEDCIRYALAHQPVIAQARIDEQISEQNLRARLADWFPQIGAVYNLQHNFQRPTSFFNGVATPVGVSNTSTGQLYANQNLFNRDLLLANRTQGDVRLLTREATEERKIDVTANVSKAFYDLLTTQQQIKVADENIARLQKSLEDAFYRYQSGVADKTDYKRAQITLNNVKASRLAITTSVDAKVENLKNLMGYPVNLSIGIAYDSLQMERQIGLDTLQPLLFPNRIEYQQLLTQEKLLQANTFYQRSAYLPTISANGVYNLNYLSNSIGKLYSSNYPNSFFGITAAVPIFQGGKRKANIKAAELQEQRNKLDIVNLVNSINSQYATALSNYKGSLANYKASKENVQLAQEVYDIIQLQYKAGVKTYLEVITSEADLRTAQFNYFNALNQVLSSKIDAERALGQIHY